MQKDAVKRCVKCGLPDTYPGIKFNDKDLCNYCVYYELYEKREESIKKQLKTKFLHTIKKVKEERHKYDGLIGLSGGKDSTYLLYLLKEKYNLNLFAFTANNGFISDTALKNISNTVRKLDLDHRFIDLDPDTINKVYRYALTSSITYPKELLALLSPLCCACHAMVLGVTLKMAIEMELPILFLGYTPGQYPSVSLENFLKIESCVHISSKVYKDDPVDILKMFSDPIREIFGEQVNKYYFKSQYVHKDTFIPKILFPFHALTDYDEEEIIKIISDKLGWEKPKDTDPFSTNCLLNSLGNYACQKQRNYHPYASEYSQLVREGKMTREDFINADDICDNPMATEYSLNKLGLTKELILKQKGYDERF